MLLYADRQGAVAVSFPLMYRTARGAFESFDQTLAQAGRTLGLSNFYIFWRVQMPVCRQGILAGRRPGRTPAPGKRRRCGWSCKGETSP